MSTGNEKSNFKPFFSNDHVLLVFCDEFIFDINNKLLAVPHMDKTVRLNAKDFLDVRTFYTNDVAVEQIH